MEGRARDRKLVLTMHDDSNRQRVFVLLPSLNIGVDWTSHTMHSHPMYKTMKLPVSLNQLVR